MNSPGLAFMARVLHTSSGMVNVVATAPCNSVYRDAAKQVHIQCKLVKNESVDSDSESTGD